ncbi:MAG: TMEM175 family protein [Anaerolineae bacterium]
MSKGRMEAFSDGVIAIIITIMVLEMRPPTSPDWSALQPLIPTFVSYILSFVLIGIYWNNHHHLLQAAQRVDGRVLWANLHLLFWLSLFPFATAWMGDTEFASGPVALYGVVFAMAGVAYTILSRALIRLHGRDSVLAEAVADATKERVSSALSFAAILLAFFYPKLAFGLYVLVAVLWFIPDSRIERLLRRSE